MAADHLDPRTPVLVGVGQTSESIDDRDYQARSAADLGGIALEHALRDAGLDPTAVAARIDTIACTRPFDRAPGMSAPLGRADNLPRAIAKRIGADPARALLEVSGGQSPQHLVTEFSDAIRRGEADLVVVASAEAISTARHLAGTDGAPDFTEHVDGQLEDRGNALRGMITRHQAEHGLTDAPTQYALLENARRSARKTPRDEHAREMGELFAPFTVVAAANPHAAAPTVRTAEELVTPSERNRVVADPYTRFLVARDQVNQAAAVVLTSVGTARELGVPEDRWVFLHGHADLRDQDLLDRPDLGAYPAAGLAIRHALEVAGIGLDDVAAFDLYSCFPIAVFAVCDEIGLAPDDPRGLTLTGGLPFFGGAGNGYSLHAIADAVERARQAPGDHVLVGANGGVCSKYSVGVYATTPAPWRPDASHELQAGLADRETVPTTQHPDGWATIETWTVRHGRNGQTGIVVGRVERTGERFLATTLEGDADALALLDADLPAGTRVGVRTYGWGSRVAATLDRLDEAHPRVTAPALRAAYEHVLVRQDGRVLEVTINRPETRNALTPDANAELAEVFDAYAADPDLWVAILTGAGDAAFSAGNDLTYMATGRPIWIPTSGFGGLTSRRDLHKPVIAAVNGFAMGGGFEIALACHLVVAVETATFALSEVRVGLAAGAGGLVRLPRKLPENLANELILTGRRATARELQTHGVVNRVVAEGMALAGARELAAQLLESSPTSVRVSLEVMGRTRDMALLDAVAHPFQAFDELLFSEDLQEGLTAFSQKRPPEWRNR